MYGEHDYEVLTSAREGLQRQEDHFGSKQRHDTDGYNIIPFGYCTYRNRSDDGKFAFNINTISEKAIVSKFYPVFRFTNANSTFMAEFLNSSPRVKKKLSVLAVGTSQVVLSFEALKAAKFDLPCKDEQDKIAAFLECLNTRIENQRTLVVALKKYKRGVTEAIFTKDLRFTTKGVPYPQWDKKYVGDICKIQTGKSNTQDETSQGSYPFYVRSPIVRKSNRYLFDCEAVLTVGDGVGTGKVFHYVTGKFDLHQRVYAMTDFKIVSGKYFYYYFSHFFYDRVMRMTAKTSVDSVRYEMIDKMAIQIPCHEEQQQIVCFLDCLEHSVIEAEKTLNLLEKLKSGCLQQLFI